MANCKNCGGPLKRGNIRLIRNRGKRPFRIHRSCPQAPSEAIQKILDTPPFQAFADELTKPQFTGKPDRGETHSWKGDTAGNVLQRPQEGTGDPLVAEGVLEYSEPPRYRYFMTQEQADRVKLAVEKTWGALGIGFEVIPVPEDQVERAPEDYADLVEVTVKWKDE